MAQSIAPARLPRHPVLPDIGKKAMAKVEPAHVRIPDIDWMPRLGAAVQWAVLQVWESNKEAAAALDVDDAEFGKWLQGTRRAQFDKLFAVEALREPLVIALAQLAGAVTSTRIEFKRTA